MVINYFKSKNKMKKFLFLSMAAIVGMLAFTSCGDDDEIEPKNPDDIKVEIGKAKFTETANQMVLTYAIAIDKINVPAKTVADFQNDKCTRFYTEYTFPTEAMAKATYEENKADADEYDTTVYSYKGKVYTEDETADYKDRPKDEIREEFKIMESLFNK